MKRIAHLRSSGGYFGAEAVMYNLLKALPSDEYDQRIVLLQNGAPTNHDFKDRLKALGVEPFILHSSFRLDPMAIVQFSKWLRKEKIEIIHCHDYKSDIIGYYARKINSNIKLVATMHGWTSMDRKVSFYEKLDAFYLRKFNYIVAVSENVARQARAENIAPEYINVVTNGVDTRLYSENGYNGKLANELEISENDFTIGAVGRLSVEKGIEDLVRALPMVIAKNKHAKLLIIGDGSESDKLNALTAELNLQQHIKFLGIRKDIPKLLPLIKLFVMPSHREGTPMALLEAMAAYRPIVATNVGGIPKLIEPGKTGLLVPPNSPEKLSEAICKLAGDPQQMQILGRNARYRVEKNFSLKRMAEQMGTFYRNV